MSELRITYDQPCAYPECREPAVVRVVRVTEEGAGETYFCSGHRDYAPEER